MSGSCSLGPPASLCSLDHSLFLTTPADLLSSSKSAAQSIARQHHIHELYATLLASCCTRNQPYYVLAALLPQYRLSPDKPLGSYPAFPTPQNVEGAEHALKSYPATAERQSNLSGGGTLSPPEDAECITSSPMPDSGWKSREMEKGSKVPGSVKYS